MADAPPPVPARKEPATRRVRVMIVDDSLTTRTVLQRVVEQDDRLCHVASASSAEAALAALETTPVDVILLDLDMPGMGGLEALPEILGRNTSAQVLVVSSLTAEGAEATLAALSMGAADTLLKPRPGGFDTAYRAGLVDRILALGEKNAGPPQDSSPAPARVRAPLRAQIAPAILAIGASTGGIHAMCQFLRCLPRDAAMPILVTQHLPAAFLDVFANQLEMASARPSRVARNGDRPRPGTILIAPGDGHMTLRGTGQDATVAISHEASTSGCTPSVDPMLATLARSHGDAAVAVILSGMGRDGVEGAALLAQAGGTIMAQDAATSAVWGMPGAVARAGIAQTVLPPEQLAQRIASRTVARAWS